MASFKTTAQGKCRAYVDCHGTRKSKTFETEELAHLWAASMETRAKRQKTLETAASGTVLATMIPKRMLAAIVSIPHSMQDVIDAAIPAKTFPGIYFLVMDGEIVYVGQSIDIPSRISRHRREGKEFDSFAYLLCEKEQLDELESLYITAFMPWLNHTITRQE